MSYPRPEPKHRPRYTFNSLHQPVFNKDNLPYSYPSNLVYTSPQAKHMSCFEKETPHLDSLQIDYKQKTFELMRKNTELEINIKQSQSDVAGLEKEVNRLSQVINDIVTMFGIKVADLERGEPRSHLRYVEEVKTILSSISKSREGIGNSGNEMENSIGGSAVSQLENQGGDERNPEVTAECQCESHYNQIIAEYKTMIEIQHENILKKDKNSTALKYQLSSLKTTHKQVQSKLAQSQQRIIKLSAELDTLSKAKAKDQQKLQIMSERMTELQGALEEKNKSIEVLMRENEQIYDEKEKIKVKYRQEIVHFEEMEKLVEEKLIEVEYEMNFYKQERQQNFEKIKKLQLELKECKLEEEKRYFSFGDHHKDACVQVDVVCESRLNENPFDEESREISLPVSKVDDQSECLSGRDGVQIECYEQSIRTLLKQNNRLKKFLLVLHGNRREGEQKEAIRDEEMQVQLKILLSTLSKDAGQSLEDRSIQHDTIKKQ